MKRFGCWTPVLLASVLISVGCASLRSRPIDINVFKDILCSDREAEAKEYLTQLGYKAPAITERIERVRKECGK